MMKPKFLGILAIVLVGLGVLSWATSRTRYSTTKGGGYTAVLEEPIDVGSVATLRAWLGSSPEEILELQRSGDGWVVSSRWGWAAKDDLVQKLLDDLDGLKGEKRASAEEVLADFQIDDEGGLHVVGLASGGTEKFHLVVGKTALRGGAFVRQHGSSDVFLTPAQLRNSFGVWGDEPKPPEAKRWIDLRVYQAEVNDVDKVVLRDGRKEIVLVKEFETIEDPALDSGDVETIEDPALDSGDVEAGEAEVPSGPPTVDRGTWTWKPDAKGEFDKNLVDGLLRTLCSLYASDVADPANLGEYGLGENARVAELTFADGTVKRIRFGSATEDDKSVYFQVEADGSPALIYKSTVDRVFKGRGELSPKAG